MTEQLQTGQLQGPTNATGAANPGVFTGTIELLSSLGQHVTYSVRRLAEIMQGHSSGLAPGSPAWLLGTYYGVLDQDQDSARLTPEVLDAFMRDFRSRVWCTYRKGMAPVLPGPAAAAAVPISQGDAGAASMMSGSTMFSQPAGALTSDVGWGCTLRSGQMLLAEALSRHVLGRGWVRSAQAAIDKRMVQLLSLFCDTPAAPLSLHAICSAGSEQGVVPGKWLGPWTLCRAFNTLLKRVRPAGMQLHVVCDPGGGAPALDVCAIRALLVEQQQGQAAVNGHGGHQEAIQGQHVEHQAGTMVEQQSCAGPSLQGQGCTAAPGSAAHQGVNSRQHAPVSNADAKLQDVSASTLQPIGKQGANVAPQHMSSTSHQQQGTPSDMPPSAQPAAGQAGARPPQASDEQLGNHVGLLLLVPLTLGVGKANPLYYPQLHAVLSWPQSVGIVGGRPSASLFFVGYQGSSLVYLDPHTIQTAGRLPDVAPTYFCDAVRLMPTAAIDPSLALGFYCRDLAEFDDLVERLRDLAAAHSKAPMLTVAEPGSVSAGEQGGVTPHHWSPSEDESDVDVDMQGATEPDQWAEHQQHGGSPKHLENTVLLLDEKGPAAVDRGSGGTAGSGVVDTNGHQDSASQLQTVGSLLSQGSAQIDSSISGQAIHGSGLQKGRGKRSRRRRSGQKGSDAEDGWEVM